MSAGVSRPASPTALAVLDDYDFSLPSEAIARTPTPRRSDSRLMVIDRDDGRIETDAAESRVRDLPDWLRPGDLLVVNTTRVLAARLVGHKASGGVAEALLLRSDATSEGPSYRAWLRCRGKLREGLEFVFAAAGEGSSSPGMRAWIEALHERGEVTLRFEAGADPYAIGRPPLPPYIVRERAASDPEQTERIDDVERYQTVFAREPGAVAAPTAGLHLTEAVFERLRAAGVERAEVVLHVGPGTFQPLDEEAFARDRLHRERFRLPPETAAAVDATRARGGRVVAVGTTTARVLESQAAGAGRVTAGEGETDLFLRPGGRGFEVVDGMLTNFHLPRSSLLMMVAAFFGREAVLACYRRAVECGFRFYSYGDAMLILPGVSRRDG